MTLKSFDKMITKDIQILTWLEEGEGYVDYYEFLGPIIHSSRYPDQFPELDRKIVQCAKALAPNFAREDYATLDKEPWPWHTEAISQGKFPLEKLPEHVRELAKELYY